jgi:DNA modification methylase
MNYKKKVQIENCTLYLGDNVNCMQDIDLSALGACVTDPPYGLNKRIAVDGGSIGRKLKNRNEQLGKCKDWDFKAPCLEFFLNLNVPCIFLGGNYFNNLPPSRKWLVWDKGTSMRNRSFADGELAYCNFDGNLRIKTFNPLKMKEEKEHLTQKPIEIMIWCIEQLPKENTGVIIDPFMGSGSTIVACVKTGRHGIGIERDEEYFNISVKRVTEAYRQRDLFI